jgi:hypothetical protein
MTVDLGAIQDSSISSEEQQLDILSMLYKKDTSDIHPVDAVADVATHAMSSAAHTPSISGLSVTELRVLLKEKHPEKHGEIQKMKKAELIQALQ